MDKEKERNRPLNNGFLYAMLRRDTLFLYDSEAQKECKGVIVLTRHVVSLYPEGLTDSEIFHKDLPVMVRRKDMFPRRRKTTDKKSTENTSTPDGSPSQGPISEIAPEAKYFLYAVSPNEKEDWFLALLRASKLDDKDAATIDTETDSQKAIQGASTTTTDPSSKNITRPNSSSCSYIKYNFDRAAILKLISTIHSDEHHCQYQWLNAFTGRIFLSLYKTPLVKAYIVQKIMKKVAKVSSKKPSFLGDIKVRELDVGDAVPLITQPRLLELAPTGDMVMEMNVDYAGGFRVDIETEAIISVTTRLKPMRFPLVLAVVLKSLSGRVRIRVKPPPSNRFWMGFYEMPKMDLVIEPILADKAVKFSVLLQAIEKRIFEMLMETMVLPNMDDYPIYPSQGTGGIFYGDPNTDASAIDPTDESENEKVTEPLPDTVPLPSSPNQGNGNSDSPTTGSPEIDGSKHLRSNNEEMSSSLKMQSPSTPTTRRWSTGITISPRGEASSDETKEMEPQITKEVPPNLPPRRAQIFSEPIVFNKETEGEGETSNAATTSIFVRPLTLQAVSVTTVPQDTANLSIPPKSAAEALTSATDSTTPSSPVENISESQSSPLRMSVAERLANADYKVRSTPPKSSNASLDEEFLEPPENYLGAEQSSVGSSLERIASSNEELASSPSRRSPFHIPKVHTSEHHIASGVLRRAGDVALRTKNSILHNVVKKK